MTASTLLSGSATLADRVRAEARDSLPVWLSVWFSVSHLYSALTLFEPDRLSAFGTVLFPLAWAGAYYYAKHRERPVDVTAVAVLSVLTPAMALLLWMPVWVAWAPADPFGRLAYELIAIASAIALLIHCRRARGWFGVLAFFGAAGLYGFLLETSGITLGYFSETGYHLYMPFTRTPVAAVAGWCTIFYPSVFVAESIAGAAPALRRRVATLALLTAAIGLSADLHFDPIATALGFWVWNERLADAFLGVPLVNFTAWITALFAFAVVYFYVTHRDWSTKKKALVLVIAVPGMQLLAGVLNLALIAALEGPGGPSVGILRDYVARLLQGT